MTALAHSHRVINAKIPEYSGAFRRHPCPYLRNPGILAAMTMTYDDLSLRYDGPIPAAVLEAYRSACLTVRQRHHSKTFQRKILSELDQLKIEHTLYERYSTQGLQCLMRDISDFKAYLSLIGHPDQ